MNRLDTYTDTVPAAAQNRLAPAHHNCASTGSNTSSEIIATTNAGSMQSAKTFSRCAVKAITPSACSHTSAATETTTLIHNTLTAPGATVSHIWMISSEKTASVPPIKKVEQAKVAIITRNFRWKQLSRRS